MGLMDMTQLSFLEVYDSPHASVHVKCPPGMLLIREVMEPHSEAHTHLYRQL